MKNVILEDLKTMLEKLTVAELKNIARLDNLSLSGKKNILLDRIYEHFIVSKETYIQESIELIEHHRFANEIFNFYTNISINKERGNELINNVLANEDNVLDINETFNLDRALVYGDEDTYISFISFLDQDRNVRQDFIERYYGTGYLIENLENKYLELYYYFFLFYLEDILKGLKTKHDIQEDWEEFWAPTGNTSDFSPGAERVIYALINGRGIGNPNSAPVGSDLFFELDDAYIHIDLKTVSTDNIGDYVSDIFVGNNQNSYNGTITINGTEKIYDNANLPTRYNKGTRKEKIVLTYFITILYDKENFDVLNINLLSMPNGELFNIYGEEILKAGKTQYEPGSDEQRTNAKTIRYKWSKSILFETLSNNRRIKVIYLKDDMDDEYKKKLILLRKIKNLQYHER